MLTGTCGGQLGEGEVNGNEVTFRFTVQFNDQDLEFTYSGTLDGDTMMGTVLVFGTMGEFTASRQEHAIREGYGRGETATARNSNGVTESRLR